MSENTSPKELRERFRIHLFAGLRVVWPIITGLLVVMVALGSTIAVIEGWSLPDGVYFAFVSGLTIGYGDLVPKTGLGRTLAVSIGFFGILLTGLVAAVGVQALHATQLAQPRE